MNEKTYVEGFFKKSEHEEVIDKLEEINRRLKVLESGCLCPQYPYVYPCVPCNPWILDPCYPYAMPSIVYTDNTAISGDVISA